MNAHVETEKVEKILAESSRNQNEAISKLVEQQAFMLEKISNLESRQEKLS